jgi:hypothetical protein
MRDGRDFFEIGKRRERKTDKKRTAEVGEKI